jgi:hypothetical protein
MRKSTFIKIGQHEYKVSLNKKDVSPLYRWERELNKVNITHKFHPEGLDAYTEIVFIALSFHNPEITKEFIEVTYTFKELDRAVVDILRWKMSVMTDIMGHGPLIGEN